MVEIAAFRRSGACYPALSRVLFVHHVARGVTVALAGRHIERRNFAPYRRVDRRKHRVDFYLSDEGLGALVEEAGYVSLPDDRRTATRDLWDARTTGSNVASA